jgi:hypothetical protein
LCAWTSMLDAIADSWLSAWSLPLIMVTSTESSVLPVGAPTTESCVRTIVTPLSRSAWMSEPERRSSVILLLISPLAATVFEEVFEESEATDEPVWLDVAPVVPVALVLLLGEVLEEVLSLATVEPVEPVVDVLPVALPEVFEEELGCEELVVLRFWSLLASEALFDEEDVSDVEPVWLLEALGDVALVELLLGEVELLASVLPVEDVSDVLPVVVALLLGCCADVAEVEF